MAKIRGGGTGKRQQEQRLRKPESCFSSDNVKHRHSDELYRNDTEMREDRSRHVKITVDRTKYLHFGLISEFQFPCVTQVTTIPKTVHSLLFSPLSFDRHQLRVRVEYK